MGGHGNNGERLGTCQGRRTETEAVLLLIARQGHRFEAQQILEERMTMGEMGGKRVLMMRTSPTVVCLSWNLGFPRSNCGILGQLWYVSGLGFLVCLMGSVPKSSHFHRWISGLIRKYGTRQICHKCDLYVWGCLLEHHVLEECFAG